MANFVGKYLYVNDGIDYVEYYEAPTTSSRAFGAMYGALLGKVTKENVAGIADSNTFLEFEKDGEKFYVIFTTREFSLSDTIKGQANPVSGNTSTNKNVFQKAIDLAKGIFDLFGKKTDTTNSSQDPSLGNDTGDSNPTTPKNETAVANPFLEWLKANWLWFMPTIILIPILIYLLIRSLIKKKATQVPQNSAL